jgi:hypothetical protein
MRIFRQSMTAAAVIGAAAALAGVSAAPALAATTSGVRYGQTYVSVGWLGPGVSGQEALCSMVLLSAAASDGSPAYVSGLLESSTSDKCTGFLQHSVSGGAWTEVSPKVTLPGTDQGLFNYPWAKTSDYYAGPGTKVRACVLTPATSVYPSKTECSSGSVTLAASSTAAPASHRTPLLYAHNNQGVTINGGGASCYAFLSSSNSLDKTAASRASMAIEGTGSCTGWLETSANNGQTWQHATPTYSIPLSNPFIDWAFSRAIPDRTGELARACAQNSTGSQACTAAW